MVLLCFVHYSLHLQRISTVFARVLFLPSVTLRKLTKSFVSFSAGCTWDSGTQSNGPDKCSQLLVEPCLFCELANLRKGVRVYSSFYGSFRCTLLCLKPLTCLHSSAAVTQTLNLDQHSIQNAKLWILFMKEQLKFIKSELARTEETTRVLEGMLANPAEAYCVLLVFYPSPVKWIIFQVSIHLVLDLHLWPSTKHPLLPAREPREGRKTSSRASQAQDLFIFHFLSIVYSVLYQEIQKGQEKKKLARRKCALQMNTFWQRGLIHLFPLVKVWMLFTYIPNFLWERVCWRVHDQIMEKMSENNVRDIFLNESCHMMGAKKEMDSDKTDCEEFDSKWGGECDFSWWQKWVKMMWWRMNMVDDSMVAKRGLKIDERTLYKSHQIIPLLYQMLLCTKKHHKFVRIFKAGEEQGHARFSGPHLKDLVWEMVGACKAL